MSDQENKHTENDCNSLGNNCILLITNGLAGIWHDVVEELYLQLQNEECDMDQWKADRCELERVLVYKEANKDVCNKVNFFLHQLQRIVLTGNHSSESQLHADQRQNA